MPAASSPHSASSSRIAMLDEPVGQAEVQHRRLQPGRGQRLAHALPAPPIRQPSSDRDDGVVAAPAPHQRDIERLDEAHVGHRGVELRRPPGAGYSSVPKARMAMREPALAARRLAPRTGGVSPFGTSDAGAAPRG